MNEATGAADASRATLRESCRLDSRFLLWPHIGNCREIRRLQTKVDSNLIVDRIEIGRLGFSWRIQLFVVRSRIAWSILSGNFDSSRKLQRLRL